MGTEAPDLSCSPIRVLPDPPDTGRGAARPPPFPMSTPFVVLLLVLLLVAVLVAVMPRLGDMVPGAEGGGQGSSPLELGGDEARELPASIAATPGSQPGLLAPDRLREQ